LRRRPGGACGQERYLLLATRAAAVGARVDAARTAVLAPVADGLTERLADVPLG
jgi:hypothetical protein